MRESTFTAWFSPLFALFPRWDCTGCLKQWELDKGRERKTILWSANRKFQTPPIFTDPYSGFEPPPPPVEDWPLLRVDPYSGFYSKDRSEKNWQFGERQKFARSSCRGFVAQWLERPTGNRKTRVRSPAGLRCVFFRLIQLSVHICRIEKERSLIWGHGNNNLSFQVIVDEKSVMQLFFFHCSVLCQNKKVFHAKTNWWSAREKTKTPVIRFYWS